MNRGVVIVAIIFWLSFRLHAPGRISLGHECEENLSALYLKGPTHAFIDALWNVQGSKTGVSIFERHPFLYLAANGDTTRLPHVFKEEMYQLHNLNYDVQFSSLDIFNVQNIVYKFYSSIQPNDRFLFYVNEPGIKYIGAAEIIEAQLDADPETERIVRTRNSLYSSYYFYDSNSYNWNFAGTVTLMDDYNCGIDFSLEGLAGLCSMDHSYGYGQFNTEYYSLENGVLHPNFKIDGECYGYLNNDATSEYSYHALSELTMINSDNYFVEFKVVLFNCDENLCDTCIRINEQKFTYTLSRSFGGPFRPDKENAAFTASHCAEGCDSTYFSTEAYANTEAIRLKEHGDERQKELLRNFVCDSAFAFK